MKKLFAIVIIFIVIVLCSTGCTKAIPNMPVFPTVTATPSVVSTPTAIPTVNFYISLQPTSGSHLNVVVTYEFGSTIETRNIALNDQGDLPLWGTGVIHANKGDHCKISVSESSITLQLKVYKRGDDYGNPIYLYEETGFSPGTEIVLE